MKAVILAAGYGRRMRPLTLTTHKALLEIAGQTILGRLVDGLTANGVNDLVVVTGHRADDIRTYLANSYPDLSVSFVHNARYAETNNVYSMALALEQCPIDDDILLIESDLICDADVFRSLLDDPQPNVALLDHYRPGMDGTVVRIRDGLITEVIPPHLQQEGFSFADTFKTLNIYKFARDFCATTFKPLVSYYANSVDENSYYELILGILIYLRRAEISAHLVDSAHWAEVDDPNDLQSAQFLFDPPARRRILDESKGGYWAFEVLDFSYLRNMYFPTPALLAQLRDALPDLVRNYGSAQPVVDRKLSYLVGGRPERIHALNGASQAFRWLRERYGQLSALLPEPTFLEWPAAFPNHATYADQVGVDSAGIEDSAADHDVVVIVNPNNPTGTLVPVDEIVELARRHSEKLVVVDESFQGFAGQPSIIERLETEPVDNVLVLASLSKSLGVPGVRLGYLYSSSAVLGEELTAWLPIWNMNSIAEHVLELVLKHRDSLVRSYEQTATDRAGLIESLRTLSCVDQVFASGGNFVLLRWQPTERGSQDIVDSLLADHAIFVKDVSARFSDDRTWLRLAVRLPAENELLVRALATLES